MKLRTAVSYCVGKEGGTVHHRHHAHHASSENEKRTELRDDVLLLLLLMMMHATAVHDRVPQPFLLSCCSIDCAVVPERLF